MGKNDSDEDYTVTTYVADKINERLDIGNKTVKDYVTNVIGNLGEKASVVEYIDAAILAFKNGDFKTAIEDIGKLKERVQVLEDAIANIPEAPSLDGYATEVYVQNYVATNVIALTNAEIDTAIGATQN
jgi:adenine specific DNA methylase Mod